MGNHTKCCAPPFLPWQSPLPPPSRLVSPRRHSTVLDLHSLLVPPALGRSGLAVSAQVVRQKAGSASSRKRFLARPRAWHTRPPCVRRRSHPSSLSSMTVTTPTPSVRASSGRFSSQACMQCNPTQRKVQYWTLQQVSSC